MKKRAIGTCGLYLMPLLALLLAGTAAAQSPPPPDRPPIPSNGVHPRLRIVNQCTTPVWTIFTPGGQANQVLVQQKSGAWFRAYAGQERFAGTGATANPSAKPTSKVTIAAPPGDTALYFVPGQFIEIVTTKNIQASTPGPTAKITAVSHRPVGKGTVLTLDRALAVPSDPLNKGTGYKAQVFADQLIDALRIPPLDGKTARNVKTFEIPDAGAPSGRFSFFSGCAKGDTDPFNQHSCAIGAADTDLAAINTVAEMSFGCNYSSNANQPADKSKCTFNPGAVAPQFPKCQESPNGANCGPLSTSDYYDVSAVDGYTFSLRVDVSAQSPALRCNTSGGDHPLPAAAASIDGAMLDLASCPTEGNATLYSTQAAQQKLINGRVSLLTRWNSKDQPDRNGAAKACVAPYKWFESATLGQPVDTATTVPNCAFGTCSSVSYYAAASCDGVNDTTLRYFCPADSGPQQRVGPHFSIKSSIYKIPDGRFSIHNTNFVKQLYAMGYKGYTWQFDDGVGLLNCPSTAAVNNPAKYTVYTITACPNGGTKNPAQPTKWAFSAGSGTCVASPGARGEKTYGSLLACQQANMHYVCDNVTGYDPYHVPDALWRADPQATLHKAGFSWSQVAKIEQKTAPSCRTISYPRGISPDFPRAVQLPLCTYYYGGGNRLCPAAAQSNED
ncbi:MAG: hypothetical protein ACREE2_20190 [Stellaceae bacterium]